MKDVVWADYIAAQIEAVDVIRALLDVPSVHAIGYCVAGTTLAATLALLAARGQADKIASATFFTAQVDFGIQGLSPVPQYSAYDPATQTRTSHILVYVCID